MMIMYERNSAAALISPNGTVYRCKRLLFGNKISPAGKTHKIELTLEMKYLPSFSIQKCLMKKWDSYWNRNLDLRGNKNTFVSFLMTS